MKYIIAIAALLGLAAVTPATAGTKKISTINGVDIYRIKNCGLFCPSLTTLVAADPKHPGEVSVLAHGASGGIVPSVAQAGGIAGGAALLRPSRSKTSVNTTASPSTTVNSGNPVVNTTVNPGGTTVNNGGSHNHHNN
jgi:hypothetical protein